MSKAAETSTTDEETKQAEMIKKRNSKKRKRDEISGSVS